MSEDPLTSPERIQDKFDVTFSEIADELPEVDAAREKLFATCKELIANYSVEQQFFESKARTLFFIAIAQQKEVLAADQEATEQAEDAQVTKDLMSLLVTSNKRDGYVEQLMQHDVPVSGEQVSDLGKVYEEFTDKATTQALEELMDELLSPLREHLGHGEGHPENPWRLAVIDIGYTSNQEEDYRVLGYSDEEGRRLTENAERFKTVGRNPHAGATHGWIEKVDGKTVLALPKPVADTILSGEESAKEHIGTLLHEYAHFQTCNLMVSDTLGSLAEERKADLISGDKGYPVLERFTEADLYIVSGVNLPAMILEHSHDESAGPFWTDVAKKIGLPRMLIMGSLMHDSFYPVSEHAATRVIKFYGGLDGFVRDMYEENLSDPDANAAMQQRMQPHIEWMKSVMAVPETYEAYHKFYQAEGMAFMIELLAEKALATEQ
jgi:hypothetical protein